MTRPYDLIVFDLDGVITTEHIYWEAARLTLWELIHVQLGAVQPYVQAVHDTAARQAILPDDMVYSFKNYAVNSNWDLTFVAVCALLVGLDKQAAPAALDAETLLASLKGRAPVAWPEAVPALLERVGDRKGAALIAWAGEQAAQAVAADPALFTPDGPLWQYLFDRFQGWFSGRMMGVWGAKPLAERPVLPVDALREILTGLRAAGYQLGVATGRPYDEAAPPLTAFGVLDLFDAARCVTYDDVVEAQTALDVTGLGKPHPFPVRRARFPEVAVESLVESDPAGAGPRTLFIGDTASDALAAQAAGVDCLGVLSGVQGEAARRERQQALQAAGCVAVVDDVAVLPDWLSRQ